MNNILAYCLIIAGVLSVGFFILKKDIHKYTSFVQLVTVFGGAFLLAVCFLNLIPHIYECSQYVIHECSQHECGQEHTQTLPFKIGIFVLFGFLIQQLLDLLSKGVEHGHLHTNSVSKNTVFTLLIGVCIHAFLEGMPIVYDSNQVQIGLVWGIVIHNIPITFILVGLFVNMGYTFRKSILLLALFAVMTPLGSLADSILLSESNPIFESIIMAFVVGILLHVSISILFYQENSKNLKFVKLIAIVAAFVIAYLLPSCTH